MEIRILVTIKMQKEKKNIAAQTSISNLNLKFDEDKKALKDLHKLKLTV